MRQIIKSIENRDIKILKFFNCSIKCKMLDTIMPIITYLGSFIFSFSFCILLLLIHKKNTFNLSIYCSLSLIFSTCVTHILKKCINRIRPFLKIDGLHINKIGIDPFSFPSGHTTAAFSVAISISLFISNIAPFVIVLATLVGISRMYLGVHYPTDVVIGAFIGCICPLILFKCLYLFTPNIISDSFLHGFMLYWHLPG